MATKVTVQVGLLSIPCTTTPVGKTHDTTVSGVHAKCGTKLISPKRCPLCDVAVVTEEIGTGVKVSRDQYVQFAPGELEKARGEGGIVQLDRFVAGKVIPLLRREKTYYVGAESRSTAAYGLLRAALVQMKVVGVGRWRTKAKTHLVMIEPGPGTSLLMSMLLYADEFRTLDDAPGLPAAGQKPKPEELTLAVQLLSAYLKDGIDDIVDETEANIKVIVDAKLAGKALPVPQPLTEQVTSLVESLQLALQAAMK